MLMKWLLVDWKYPLLVFITGSNFCLNQCSPQFNRRALLCQMSPQDYSSYRRRLQPARLSLLCLWLYASVSQEKGMWCLNTPDSLRQSLSSGQNRGVWKEQDLLLQSKKCNYLNTARHHCLKLAKARQEKPGVITLYLSPSSGTTTVHSPRAYFVSIFPCTLLQFLHNSKDIL